MFASPFQGMEEVIALFIIMLRIKSQPDCYMEEITRQITSKCSRIKPRQLQ